MASLLSWLPSITEDLSAVEVWIGVTSAVTVISSVTLPMSRARRPKSRFSLRPTIMSLTIRVLKPLAWTLIL